MNNSKIKEKMTGQNEKYIKKLHRVFSFYIVRTIEKIRMMEDGYVVVMVSRYAYLDAKMLMELNDLGLIRIEMVKAGFKLTFDYEKNNVIL